MNWESQCNWSARSSSHSWRINFIFLLFIFNCMPYHCGAFVFGKELWPADQALGAPNHKSLPTSFSFKASHSRWKRMIGHMKVCVFLPKSLCTVNTLYTFFFFFHFLFLSYLPLITGSWLVLLRAARLTWWRIPLLPGAFLFPPEGLVLMV